MPFARLGLGHACPYIDYGPIRSARYAESMGIDEVFELVRGFSIPDDGSCEKSRELILDLLLHTPKPFARSQFKPGHITATALVASPEGSRVLLVHHRRLDRWLLPGGHVEFEDASIADTARREAIEETGVVLAAETASLTGVDVHGIPSGKGEPFHLHHDLLFVFRATEERLDLSEEARAVVWATPAEFESYAIPLNIRLAWQRLQISTTDK